MSCANMASRGMFWSERAITDAHGGTVLTAKSQGSWFFTQLPPGAYAVDVSTPGQGLRQPLDFRWRWQQAHGARAAALNVGVRDLYT